MQAVTAIGESGSDLEGKWGGLEGRKEGRNTKIKL